MSQQMFSRLFLEILSRCDTCFKFSAAVTCKDVARKRQKIAFYFWGGVVVVIFFGLVFLHL